MTRATAAANTASSQNSDFILPFRLSPRGAFPARLEAAHRVQAIGDGRHLEADRGGGELLDLRQRVGGGLGARVEVALDPRLRGAQVLAIAGLVAREERQACAEEAQAQVLAHE